MKLRRLLSVILAAMCVLSTACGGMAPREAALAPAEQFVCETSAEELREIVRYANCLLIGPVISFDDAHELPMLNILNMYCAEQAKNTEETCERINISTLADFTESRFGEGVFDEQAWSGSEPAGVRIEEGVIYPHGFGNMAGYLAGEITVKSVVREGDLVNIAVEIALDEAGRDLAQGELTLRITEQGYQYAAYQFTARPWTVADMALPMAEPLPWDVIEAYFGEARSSQLFQWVVDDLGQKNIYSDGTEVTLYLGQAASPTGVIMRITTRRADLALIKGVRIGDTEEAVVKRFMSGGYELETAEQGQKWRRLYGQPEYMATYGLIRYEQDRPTAIEYGQEGASVRLDLNENACVEAISVFFE